MQVWGPRFSAYVVPQCDFALFTLGRLPEAGAPLARARDLAARLQTALAGRRMGARAAACAVGEHDINRLRYAAPTGTFAIRWDGARQPEIWNVPAPEITPLEARLELARRFLHVFGPSTSASFAGWAGIGEALGHATFAALERETMPVNTPIGAARILRRDEPTFRAAPTAPAPARLLPSGDTWFLQHVAERELLVPDERQRRALWTSRVWPGALLVEGETVGTWRRAEHRVTVEPWRRPTRAQRSAVQAEAATLPLPGLERPIEVHWAGS